MSPQERRSWEPTALALVLAFSLLSKLGLTLLVWFRNRIAVWHPDSASYHQLATNMLSHGVFSRSNGVPFAYESFRTPGYPLLLSAMYALFGDSALPVMVLQAVAATGTVALTWLLGRRLFGSHVGALAAAILCLDISSICSTQMVMSETVFTLLVLVAAWLLVVSLSPRRGWVGFALSGLALACAVHVRPIGYYLVPLAAAGIAAYVVLKDRSAVAGRVRWRLALSRAGAFVLAPVVLVGGWQLNSLRHTGSARFSHLEGLNMYFYRAAGAVSMRDHKPLFRVHREMGLETERTDFTGWVARRPEFAGRNYAALGNEWFREGVATIVRNPGWYALMHLRSTAALLLDPGTFSLATMAGIETDARGQELLARLQVAPATFVPMLWAGHRFLFLSSTLALALLAVLYAGVVLWLVRSPRSAWTAGAVLVVVVSAYFVVISAGPEAASRFRVPLAPLLAILAAAGWESLRKTRLQRQSAPIVGAARNPTS